MSEAWIPILGTVAGLCTTGSFVPQVIKAWREGDCAAISKRMYLATVSALSLWIVYGFLIGSWPLIVFNIVSLALSATVLCLKIRSDGRGGEAPRPS